MKGSCCHRTDASATAEIDHAVILARVEEIAPGPVDLRAEITARLITIAGGIFSMGARRSTFATDRDSPRRKIRLDPFCIAACAVSNAEFRAFVQHTGYRTVAEDEGWSFVFHLFLTDPARWPVHPIGLPWWRRVDGACWFAPEGPGSDLRGRESHPVVHVSWYDALAYCAWSGTVLPSEAQWECAARGGLANRRFPWGDQLIPNGAHAMNTWQGRFPSVNTGDDGWIGTAPVQSYAPNGFGLHNMTGNVWEWVVDRFGDLPIKPAGLPRNPHGPDHGLERVQRGGSYLCHDSYCDRYHVHSRIGNDPSSTMGHAGFRVASCVPAVTQNTVPPSPA